MASSRYGVGVTLRLIHVATGDQLLEFLYPYEICCMFPPLAVSERGDRVLAPGENVTLLARDGAVLTTVDLPHDPPSGPFPELPAFAQLSRDGEVAAWSTWPSGRVYVQRGTEEPWSLELGTGDAFAAVAVSGDGAWVAVSTPQRAFLFRAGDPVPVQAWELAGDEVYMGIQDVAVSDDGRLVATFRMTAGKNLSLLLLRPGEARPVAEARLDPGGFGTLRMARDGSWIAAGAAGKRAGLFAADGVKLADFGPGSQVEDALRIDGQDFVLTYSGEALDLHRVSAHGASRLETVSTSAGMFSHALLPDGFAAVERHVYDNNLSLAKRYRWEDFR